MPTGRARRRCAVGVVLVTALAGAALAAPPEVLEIEVVDAVAGKALPGVSLRCLAYLGNRNFAEITSLGPGGTARVTGARGPAISFRAA